MSRYNDIKQNETAFEMRARLEAASRTAPRPARRNETSFEMLARLTGEHQAPAHQQRQRNTRRDPQPTHRHPQRVQRQPHHEHHDERPRNAPRQDVARVEPQTIKPNETAFEMMARLEAQPASRGPIRADETAFEMQARLEGAASPSLGYQVVDLSVGARRTPTPTMS